MTTTEDDPREIVNVRLRSSSVARIDAIAHKMDWTRSQVMRTLFALGLRAWDRGERP